MNRRNFIQSAISSLLAFFFLDKSDDFINVDSESLFMNKNITIVSSVDSGQWYHICGVYEGNTSAASIRWYVNGEEVIR